MTIEQRRKFIRQFTAGLAGAALLPSQLASQNKTQISKLSGDTLDESFWEKVKTQFKLNDGLRYFNNASLGPSPIPVQEATNTFRATLDAFPSRYMWGGWKDEKEIVRTNVAKLFHVSPEEIAITHNTTEGMNLIARSFDLQPGDEVILDDHEHPSGTIPWQFWQESKGVKLVRPTLPLIPNNKEELVDAFAKAITPRTKVISMCHIVNTNGMILPVKEVSELAHKQGIMVAVDGAQTAGMLDIDLHDLGCDFYTASAHKWLFSPKGICVFYAKQSSQPKLKPLVVARGHTDSSIRRLENYNTRNLPEYLGLGSAIDFINEIGADKMASRYYKLKTYFRQQLKEDKRFVMKSPENDDLSCAIQTVEVVGKNVKEVKNRLFEEYNIDTRPMTTYGLNGVRVSLGLYLTKADIDYLVRALKSIAS